MARQELRSFAPGAFFRALPTPGQCSVVPDNTVHRVGSKKLLGRVSLWSMGQQLDSNLGTQRSNPVR